MLYNEIRSSFLNFFGKKGHKVLPSGPLVPNDPTLLFANAGMVQFKDLFLGKDKRDYDIATTSQKCLRISGKHNDLEQVGFTKRHHTFFEMLGNFSFGKYFKEMAITYAWEFLTKELGLNPNKLYITVFSEDIDAANLWKRISGKDVIKISTSDNFWSMGDVGPCGPCSEIYYDHGEKYQGSLPADDVDTGDRYVEIWNLVFMQYNQSSNGRELLLRPCIDTGMGLERISAVMQGVCDNFEIDAFKSIINNASEFIKNKDIKSPSYKIIADHLRASTFLISEGILPSNEGRGYVLRRVIRRAIRHIDKLCQSDELVFYKLVHNFIGDIGSYYTELKVNESLITETLKQEEEKFRETLKVGLKILRKELEVSNIISDEVAFKLYDTYGFPIDLTENITSEYNKKVDIDGFYDLLKKQKITSKAAWVGSGDKSESNTLYELKNKIKATDFLGYKFNSLDNANIISIIRNDELINNAKNGESVALILDKTPFYAESGGEIGDSGKIYANGFEFNVITTRKIFNSIIMHIGYIVKGECSVSDIVNAEVDDLKRSLIRRNHTAAHLLHKALKIRFGEHVVQKGSYVADNKFHFDFNYNSALSDDDIRFIEEKVNSIIYKKIPVVTECMPKDQAIEKGAVALFGEKYEDSVRVVSVEDFSKELCGGLHAFNTADLVIFKIKSECSIGSGIRRIEGLTSTGAINYLNDALEIVNRLSNKLTCPINLIEEKLENLYEKVKYLENRLLFVTIDDIAKSVKCKKGDDFDLYYVVSNSDCIKKIRDVSDKVLLGKNNCIVLIVLNDEKNKKSTVSIAVKDSLLSQYDARDFIKKITKAISGHGGGKADFAQCGGEFCNDIEDLVKIII